MANENNVDFAEDILQTDKTKQDHSEKVKKKKSD